jgi:hypothetical protein
LSLVANFIGLQNWEQGLLMLKNRCFLLKSAVFCHFLVALGSFWEPIFRYF